MANLKEQIELASINAPPGILPTGTKFDSYIGQNVINLSKVILTEHQVTALEKGLTFCPTPGAPDKSQIWDDFKEFHRRLELMQFFNPTDDTTESNINQSVIDFMNENAKEDMNDSPADNVDPYKEIHRPFKNKSTWKPNPPNRTLDTYKRAFKMNLLNTKVKQCHQHNLTKEQWKGLMELRKNPEIVIKKADKGSAVVIMNTTDYLREGYRQISEKICKVLTEMKKFKLITEKNLEYLNIKDPKAGRFYLLPKIHKKQVPGRPICSSIGHPTCNISKFVDAHIKGYVPQTKSYVRDTQHFISRLLEMGKIPDGALLVTLDVSSLYTNRKDRTKDPITPYILELLKLVLQSMNFTFNDDHYLQVGGTAIGTGVAPN